MKPTKLALEKKQPNPELSHEQKMQIIKKASAKCKA